MYKKDSLVIIHSPGFMPIDPGVPFEKKFLKNFSWQK
jgi:hypothetical protein